MSLSRRSMLLGLGLGCGALQCGVAADESDDPPLAVRVLQRPAVGNRRYAPVFVCVAVSPDGHRVAAGGDDHVMRVWDAQAGTLLHELAGHRDWIRAVRFFPSGSQLLTAGNDRRLLRWTISDGGIVYRQFAQQDGAVAAVALQGEPTHVAAVGFEPRLALYNLGNGTSRRQLACPCRDMRAVAFAPRGGILAAAGRNGHIRIWKLEDLQRPARDIPAHRQRIRALEFSPDGGHLVSAGEDRSVRIWNADTGEMQMQWDTPGAKVFAVAFLDEDKLATAGSDNLIRLWDLAAGRQTDVLRGHTGSVAALDYRHGVLASASFDTTVRVWDVSQFGGPRAPLAARPAETR